MADPPVPAGDQLPSDLADELLAAATAIKARAQATSRRIERAAVLSRERIAADLARIDEQATRVAELVLALRARDDALSAGGPRPQP